MVWPYTFTFVFYWHGCNFNSGSSNCLWFLEFSIQFFLNYKNSCKGDWLILA